MATDQELLDGLAHLQDELAEAGAAGGAAAAGAGFPREAAMAAAAAAYGRDVDDVLSDAAATIEDTIRILTSEGLSIAGGGADGLRPAGVCVKHVSAGGGRVRGGG
jgi:hypothetical protein